MNNACVIRQKHNESIGPNGENIIIPSIAMEEIRQSFSLESDDLSTLQRTATVADTEDLANNWELSKICLQCRAEERQMASIPCGHLVTCNPCHKSLKSCPVCEHAIEAFVRIYLS